MAKQTVNLGTSPNKGDGDPIRTAMRKINENFDELYAGNFADPENTASNIIPSADGTYDLGSADKAWSDIYVKDFIYIGGIRLEASGDTILIGGDVVAREDTVGSVFGDDSTILVDGVSNVINLNGTIADDIIPNANEAYDLGSATNRFRDLYLSGSTIDLGGTTISVVGGELQLGGVKVPTTADVAATVASAVSAPTGDLTGSVFADDSTLLVDGVSGTVPGTLTGNWISSGNKFNVFGEGIDVTTGSSIFSVVDPGLSFTNSYNGESVALSVSGGGLALSGTGNLSIAMDTLAISLGAGASMAVSNDWAIAVGGDVNLAATNINIGGTTTASGSFGGAFDGDLTGSVFADDSTVLVDGINGKFFGDLDASTIETSLIISQGGNFNSTGQNIIIGAANGITKGGQVIIGGGVGVDGAGGDASIGGGTGSDGAGGDAFVVGGLGSTIGGDVFISGGIGQSGQGGDISVTGGVGDTNGGNVTVRAGIGLDGQGGDLTIGAGNGSATGGDILVYGGGGGFDPGDVGGRVTIQGGAGTTGGDLRLYGGTGSGNVIIDGGGTSGNIDIGGNNTGAINIGNTGVTTTTINGDLDLTNATVTGLTANTFGLTYSDPGGGGSTQVGLSADIFDFGTGNIVDLQGNTLLFDSATVQDFAPGNVYALNGQYLYITSKRSGGTTTNATFTYDTNISNVRQTFYGKTEFANNGQAPIVDFTGATVTGLTLNGNIVTTSITNDNDIDIASGDDVAIITSAGNNDYEWFFNSGGYLSFPPNGELFFDGDAGIVFSTVYDVAGSTAHIDIRDTGSTANLSIDNDAANGTIDITANGYVTIATDDDGTRYEFNFGADGSLTLPGAVVTTPNTSTGGANSGTATALDVTKTLQVLNSADSNDDWWSLADGTEGQIMHFVPGTGAGTNQHKVTIANWRRWDDGAGVAGEWVVETNLDWLPFKLDFDGTRWTGVATAIFTNGAWQTSNPWID